MVRRARQYVVLRERYPTQGAGLKRSSHQPIGVLLFLPDRRNHGSRLYGKWTFFLLSWLWEIRADGNGARSIVDTPHVIPLRTACGTFAEPSSGARTLSVTEVKPVTQAYFRGVPVCACIANTAAARGHNQEE